MAKLRRGCRRIFLILVALFACAIVGTVSNILTKPQTDATRTAEADRGLTAIAMSQATASIIALTPSNTPTVTLTPSLTLTPSDTPPPSATPLSSSTPLPTETPTMTFTPTAIPTDQQEEAALRAALALRPGEYKIEFNDNRLVYQGKIEGDRNVIITVINDNRNERVDTTIALLILRAVGKALDTVDVDRVIVNVRYGNRESSMTSVTLYYARQDVLDYASGLLTDAQMLTRQEK